jgi:hypothetical protein
VTTFQKADDAARIDYVDPRPDQLAPNMMLRVGKKSQRPDEWLPAISLEVKDDVVRVLFHPGVAYETELWITAADVRLAWTVHGIDFFSLCKRHSGAQVFSTAPLRSYH